MYDSLLSLKASTACGVSLKSFRETFCMSSRTRRMNGALGIRGSVDICKRTTSTNTGGLCLRFAAPLAGALLAAALAGLVGAAASVIVARLSERLKSSKTSSSLSTDESFWRSRPFLLGTALGAAFACFSFAFDDFAAPVCFLLMLKFVCCYRFGSCDSICLLIFYRS